MDLNNIYLYGINPILEALRAGAPLEKIYVRYGMQLDRRIHQLAKQQGVPIAMLSHQRFLRLAGEIGALQHHQGIIALRCAYRQATLDDVLAYFDLHRSLVVACDQITDPHNLGAIVRTACAAGVQAIIASEHHTAAITPAALSAASGAFEHVSVVRVPSLVTALTKAKEHGYWVIGTSGNGTHLYTDPLYDRPVIVVIGSEGRGMRRSVEKVCDAIVRIPLYGPLESLNASVAAGIVLFEIVRQRTTTVAS